MTNKFVTDVEADFEKAWDWLNAERAKIAVAFAPTITAIEGILAKDLPVLFGAATTAIEMAATGASPVTGALALVKIGAEAAGAAAAAQEIPAAETALIALANNAQAVVTAKLAAPDAQTPAPTPAPTPQPGT